MKTYKSLISIIANAKDYSREELQSELKSSLRNFIAVKAPAKTIYNAN